MENIPNGIFKETIFSFFYFLLLMYINYTKVLHCGISHVCILYFDQFNPTIALSFPGPPTIFFNSFQWVTLCHLHT
jgi:hypothetical protein